MAASGGFDGTVRRSVRRSWNQRLLLGLNCVVIVACFGGAAAVLVVRHYGNSIPRVDLPSQTVPPDGALLDAEPDDGEGGGTATAAPIDTGPVETFPEVDPDTKNILITGVDNNACIDPDSPFAAAFGDRESAGDRSDTIMLMRVDPSNRRAALLSFPRDLWVRIAEKDRDNRINSAYIRDDPSRLIKTINLNFGILIDHFIQVDFCAFQRIVDAVGGVTVPFELPARDEDTGLNVPEPGCFTFSGDHALAYVRSRHFDTMDASGEWTEDPRADLGRISRQQDFVQRMLTSALDKGLNPSVARDIISAVQDYIVLDGDLTPSRLLEYAGILSEFEPGAIAAYQIKTERLIVGDLDVLRPLVKGDEMRAVLAIFRGEAPLVATPDTATIDTAATAGTAGTEAAPTGPGTETTTPTAASVPTASSLDEGAGSDMEC